MFRLCSQKSTGGADARADDEARKMGTRSGERQSRALNWRFRPLAEPPNAKVRCEPHDPGDFSNTRYLSLAACSGGFGDDASDDATSVTSAQTPGPVAASQSDPAKPGGADLLPMDHRVSSRDTPIGLPPSSESDSGGLGAVIVPERFRGL